MKFAVVLLLIVIFGACERTPESLEEWRNAEGGFEKMVEWAKSSEEPMAVRVRAVEILVEEQQLTKLQQLFDAIEDQDASQQIVEQVFPLVQAMWDKNDIPKIEKSNESGLVKVGKSDSVNAKDIAYHLYPHATDGTKKSIEKILSAWVSKDQDVRTQLGNVTVGQAAGRAGKDGLNHLMQWVANTDRVATVANRIRADADDEVKKQLAIAIRKRAEAAHPNLDEKGVKMAVLQTEHAEMTPYLKKALLAPDTPPGLIDGLMDLYIKIKKDAATPLFAQLIAERSGLIRWVSATRLIEIRGKPGILVAMKSLPLDANAYTWEDDKSFEKEATIFCNFASTEMVKLDIKSVDDVLAKALKSERWPVQAIGLKCAEIMKASKVSAEVAQLSKSRTAVPAWGKIKNIGGIARATGL